MTGGILYHQAGMEEPNGQSGVTRLAPSPTGALHLGNIRTFVVNYVLARQLGWRVLMRIEDLDGPRVKAGSVDQTLELLDWLGLQWEPEVVVQSQRSLVYQNALEQLIYAGVAYPCTCSRKDVQTAAGAPHRDDGVVAYLNLCRGRFRSALHAEQVTSRSPAWRVHVDDTPIEVNDQFCGLHRFNLQEECGDFVIFRNEGMAGYQLAVVVDDAEAGVDAIVRGQDLLESAARQIHLRKLLGIGPEPNYWHLPLVIGPDGRRLAKRHGDTRVSYYRGKGACQERILGLIAYWSGVLSERKRISMEEFIDGFDLSKVSEEPVVFNELDDAFLAGD